GLGWRLRCTFACVGGFAATAAALLGGGCAFLGFVRRAGRCAISGFRSSAHVAKTQIVRGLCGLRFVGRVIGVGALDAACLVGARLALLVFALGVDHVLAHVVADVLEG